jgi:hypothetical protein
MAKDMQDKVDKDDLAASKSVFIPSELFSHDEQIFSPEILRSSLFTGRKSGPREFYDNQAISTIGDCSILYTGEELRVSDLEVIKFVLSQLKGRPVRSSEEGLSVRFTRFEACQTIFGASGGSEYRKLNDSLNRLAKKSSITFFYQRSDGSSIKLEGVSLIRKFLDVSDKNHKRGLVEAFLEPEIVMLLGFEHSILPLNTDRLSPQAVKIRDYLITRPDQYEVINLDQLRNVIWSSRATDASIRNQLARVSKQLVDNRYLRSKIRINKYNELEFDVGERIDANRNSDPNQFMLQLDF